MRKGTIAMIFIGIAISFFAGLKCKKTFSDIDEIGKPLLTTVRLKNDKLEDTIYLVTKRWGLTGDHQVFALTMTQPENEQWLPNPSTDLIWNGNNTIFYQQKDDTIKISSLQLPNKKYELKTNQIILVEQINIRTYHKLREQVDASIKIIE
jgi:hypothetical protein